MKFRLTAAISFVAFAIAKAPAASITSTTIVPFVGAEDISHLGNPTSDTLNINGTGNANSGLNDGSTYVADDRTTQGQTFTVAGAATINGIWVKHVGYTTSLANGTYSGLTDGTSITVRVLSVSGTTLTQISSESATVTSGNGIGGSGQNWGGSGKDGSDKWLHITFDTPVPLASAGAYAFDLTSSGPYFELAGLEAGTYSGGAAYTTATKSALSTESTINGAGPAADHGTGDRTFVVDIASNQPPIPAFVLSPANSPASVGGTLTLTSVANGDPTPTFQWQYSSNGTTGWADISGAEAANLDFFYVLYSDNGFYRVKATNSNGSGTSGSARVTVTYPNPVITVQPKPAAAGQGEAVSFFVQASSLGTQSYQWYKNNVAIAEASNPTSTTSTLDITNVTAGDAGNYKVVVTDHTAQDEQGLPVTSTTSDDAVLSYFPPWSGMVSQEPFSIAAGYVAGELPTQNPTVTGYSGAWMDVDFGDAEPAVVAGSLVYANASYLGSTGDKVSVATDVTGGEITAANSGRVFRLLDAPLVAGDGTTGTRYLSFLFQSGQETGATVYQTLGLYNGDTADGNRNFDIGLTNNGGQDGAHYDFGIDGTYTSSGVAADANVHLLVVKFELNASAASDNVTVWVDPVLGGTGDPAGGVTINGADLTWDRLAFSDYDGNSAAWDEIRWGSTFNSVTLSTTPANTYAAWIAGYPAVGAKTGFNDDADSDGIKNGLENLFGTSPAVSSQGITQIVRTGNTVTFQHPHNTTPASDISASYVWSTDLVTFNAGGATAGGTTVIFAPNTVGSVTTVTATITGTIPAKLFLALRATKTP